MIKDCIKTFCFELYGLLFSIPYYLFRLFKIKNNYVYVYGFLSQGYGDHPKYIIEKLVQNKEKILVFWETNNIDSNHPQNVRYVKPRSFSAFYAQTISKIWISTVRMPYYVRKRHDQIYFQTWHGSLAIKQIEAQNLEALTERYIRMAKHDSKLIDYYISPNDNQSELFRKYFWYHGGKILKIGSPRCDVFYSVNMKQKQDIKRKHNIHNCNVLLYAPTFRRSRSLTSYNLNIQKILDKLESKTHEKWIAYIRMHPTMAESAKQLYKYDDKIRNGSLIEDIQELLLITNILVTDYSSIVFDYINGDGLACIFAPDIEEYKRERDYNIDLEDTPFSIATNTDNLIDNIMSTNMYEYRKKVEEFKKKYGYYDNGTASIIVADYISKFIHQKNN